MAHGKEFKAAIKVASTWATATTCGAGDGIQLKSGGPAGGAEAIPDETATGNLWGDPHRAGNAKYDFPIVCEGKYRGLEALIGLGLGTSQSTPTQIEAGAYIHDFTPADSSEPIGTLVVDKSVSEWEVDSLKVASLTIRGSRGEPMEVEAQIIGRSLARGTGVNDSTTFASVTIPTGELAFFSQGRFRMNTQAGATLSTNIGIDSFEITIDHAYDQDSFRADGTNTKVRAEPSKDGQPRVSGRFTLDEYSADTYRALREALTQQKMEFQITGSTLIGATAYPYLRVQCPYIQLPEDDPNMSGPGRVPEEITFDAFPVSSAPTGMTITSAVQVRIVSTLTTDPVSGNTYS